jgi:hypothetical protein
MSVTRRLRAVKPLATSAVSERARLLAEIARLELLDEVDRRVIPNRQRQPAVHSRPPATRFRLRAGAG